MHWQYAAKHLKKLAQTIQVLSLISTQWCLMHQAGEHEPWLRFAMCKAILTF